MFLEILTQLMKERGITKSVLARESGVPYTTIDGFYKKGCDNVKLSTLQKLAKYFGVSLDYLICGDNIELTNHEKALVRAYRDNPNMQSAVDRLLGIEESKITVSQKVARSGDDRAVDALKMTSDRVVKFENAETDDDI